MTDTILTAPPRAGRPNSNEPSVGTDADDPARLAELANLHDIFDGQEHGRERRALLAFGVHTD